MMMLLEKSWIRIMVVKPPSARPENFCTSAIVPSTSETSSIIPPSTVTSCMGAAENEAILSTAYFASAGVDHLELPPARFCTSKGMLTVLKPIHAESARKKAFRSRMLMRTLTAFRSSSLKSEAFAMSMPVARLMRE